VIIPGFKGLLFGRCRLQEPHRQHRKQRSYRGRRLPRSGSSADMYVAGFHLSGIPSSSLSAPTVFCFQCADLIHPLPCTHYPLIQTFPGRPRDLRSVRRARIRRDLAAATVRPSALADSASEHSFP
jgi:hypothetical protein